MDSALRALERKAAQGDPEPYVAAARRLGAQAHYEALRAVGWVTAEQARALAYCGDEGARAGIGWPPETKPGEHWTGTGIGGTFEPLRVTRSRLGIPSSRWHPTQGIEQARHDGAIRKASTSHEIGVLTLDSWFRGLLLSPLLDLSDPRISVTTCRCGWKVNLECHGHARAVPWSPTPDERQRWYAVLVARDVARAAWEIRALVMRNAGGVAKTLDAVSAWLRDPSEENARPSAWDGVPLWIPSDLPALSRLGSPAFAFRFGGCLTSASQLGVDVRAVALEALRPHCGRWEV